MWPIQPITQQMKYLYKLVKLDTESLSDITLTPMRKTCMFFLNHFFLGFRYACFNHDNQRYEVQDWTGWYGAFQGKEIKYNVIER